MSVSGSVGGVLSQVSDAISMFPVSAKQPRVMGKSKVISQSAVGSEVAEVCETSRFPAVFHVTKKSVDLSVCGATPHETSELSSHQMHLVRISSGAVPEVAATLLDLGRSGRMG